MRVVVGEGEGRRPAFSPGPGDSACHGGQGEGRRLNQLTQKTQCLAEFLAGGEGSMGVQIYIYILALMAQQKQQAEQLALLEAARPVEAVAYPMNRKSKGKKGRRGL